MVEWRNKGDDGRVGLLLGRSVAGVEEKVLVRITGLLWICAQMVGEEETPDIYT